MHNLTAGDFLGVVSPNTPPDATNATASGNEDTTIPITLTGTDSDGTIASVTVNTLLPNGTLYVDVGLTMVVSPGATFSGSSMTLYFKPDANFNGGVSFQFTVTDDDGASDATPATASITVNSVNDAPVAADDTASVDEDGVLAGASVLGNDDDSHGGAPSENNLPLTAVLVDDVAHGALVLTADGTFTYTPDGDFNGTDSFTYQAKDSLGGVSNTATVTITVNSVNDAPVNTVPVAQVVNEDTNLSITGLSVSDVDAGGGTITVTLSVLHGTLTISTSVLGGLGGSNVAGNGTGSVTLTGTLTQINTTLAALNAVVYRGNLNYNGPDTLTMTSNDQGNTGSPGPLTDMDTVAITVNPVNDAPTAVNDTWIISKNTTAIMPALVLVGNDTDPDGDHLMIVSVGAATNGGLVSLNADGTITYISDGVGVSNTDTFTYTVSDGHGGTSTATANISIVDVGSAATGDNVNLSSSTYNASYIDTAGGTDTVTGGNALNIIVGGDKADILIGGTGDDVLQGGKDNDTLNGGAGGVDLIDFSEQTTSFSFTLAAGGTGTATVNGIDSYTNIDGVAGGSGNDSLTGNGSDNKLVGHGGTDSLSGVGGNDTLVGGLGADTLTGGTGSDTFVHGSLSEALSAADVIADFDIRAPGSGGDRLDISGLVGGFTGVPTTLTLASLQAGVFITFTGSGAGGNTNTVISFDSNGSVAGGSTGTLVTLNGVHFTDSATSVTDLADNVIVV